MSEWSHTKGSVEIYRVRGPHTWADFVIDDLGEGKGQIFINSDYGAWSYYWGHMGQGGIKSFLLSIDDAYFMGKVSHRDWFDEDATKKSFLAYLNENCKHLGNYNELVMEVNDAEWMNENMCYWSLSDELSSVFIDGYPPIVMDHPSDLRQFMKVIFPEFRNILRSEIESNILVND